MNKLQPTFLRLALQAMFVIGILGAFGAISGYDGYGGATDYLFLLFFFFVIILPLLMLWAWIAGKLYRVFNRQNFIPSQYMLVVGALFSLLHLFPYFFDVNGLTLLLWPISIAFVDIPVHIASWGSLAWIVTPVMTISFAIAAKDNQIIENDQLG
jgi:hypothetical protein